MNIIMEYSGVKTSKLKLKGEKRKKKHKTDKRDRNNDASKQSSSSKREIEEDTSSHAGWFRLTTMEDVSGQVCIETTHFSYIRALDNGLFISSSPHLSKEAPDPEEILSVIKAGDTRIALKSGYGKYLSVDANNRLIGRSEAVGEREQFQVVFQVS